MTASLYAFLGVCMFLGWVVALGILFGSSDGSELELIFRRTRIKAVVLSLPHRSILSVSDIDILQEDGWVALGRNNISEISGLSTSSEASIDKWLSKTKRRTISTDRPGKTQLRLTFCQETAISGIRISNRPDGLWNRSQFLNVRVVLPNGNEQLLFSGSDKACVSDYFAALANRAMATQSDLTPQIFACLSIVNKLIAQEGARPLATEALHALNSLHDSAFDDLSRLRIGHKDSNAKSAVAPSPLARFILSSILFIKAHGINSEDVIAREFACRVACSSTRVAFERIKINPKELINNTLFDLLNAQLARPPLVALLGHTVAMAHDVIRKERLQSDLEMLTVAHAVQCEVAARRIGVCYVAYGALLGLIRNGKLLAHDDDMDLLLRIASAADLDAVISEMSELAKSLGYRVQIIDTNDPGPGRFLVCTNANGLHFDVFFCWPVETEATLLELPLAKVRNGQMDGGILGDGSWRVFHGLEIRIPAHPERFLEVRYGSDWREPDYLFRLREGCRELGLIEYRPKPRHQKGREKEHEDWNNLWHL